MALEAINAAVPSTIGGSADLTGSNNTKTKSLEPLTADNYAGRYVYYGIREFGMAAAMNGMALHGGVIPYGGTFLVFTDYARPAIRLSASPPRWPLPSQRRSPIPRSRGGRKLRLPRRSVGWNLQFLQLLLELGDLLVPPFEDRPEIRI